MATTKGIMGYLKFQNAGIIDELRVNSVSLKASQEVTPTDTIDGAYDHTAYRLGPVRVEGDVAFPVPASSTYFNSIIEIAAKRDVNGILVNRNIEVQANYDHTIHYLYKECSVNNLSVSVPSEEALTFTYSLIGTRRASGLNVDPGTLAPERVLTWDAVTISSTNSKGTGGVTPEQVRSFNFSINNNVTVFYGLNGQIFAARDNIVAGKRAVSGDWEVSWNGSGLVDEAYNFNTLPQYCTSEGDINFAVRTGCGEAVTTHNLVFLGVIFDLEDISMTNDFFMGTQTWNAYGKSTNGYKALTLDGVAI